MLGPDLGRLTNLADWLGPGFGFPFHAVIQLTKAGPSLGHVKISVRTVLDLINFIILQWIWDFKYVELDDLK